MYFKSKIEKLKKYFNFPKKKLSSRNKNLEFLLNLKEKIKNLEYLILW
jgi:hypothetical protein